MKKRLAMIGIFFSVVLILLTIAIYKYSNRRISNDTISSYIVDLNEIEQLGSSGDYEKMAEKSKELQNELSKTDTILRATKSLWILCVTGITTIFVLIIYLYMAVLKPFDKMKNFTKQISQGNFDLPLDYERTNYFGDFTWAFDSMRKEIIKARACEHEAIENNKTVIATLSHDIKTPISSIRAYSEGIAAGFDDTPEKRKKYVDVIMRKCDEVSKLTNDLFIHSLADMDKLKISNEEIELSSYMEKILLETDPDGKDIRYIKPEFNVRINVDKNRLEQIIENLINNARKYAKSDICITIEKKSEVVEIHVRDYGEGIPDNDMPFIFDKFYRGENSETEQGTGLGLYIVKHLTERMNGNVVLENHADGLEVVLIFPLP